MPASRIRPSALAAVLLGGVGLVACRATAPAPAGGAPPPGIVETGGTAPLSEGTLQDLANLLTSYGEPRSVAGFVEERREDLPEVPVPDDEEPVAPPPSDPVDAPVEEVADDEDDEPSINPYLEFGERILVHPDGRITKPFPVSPQKGAKLLQLMALYAPFPLKWVQVAAGDAPKTPEELGVGEIDPEGVEIILLEGWDLEFFENMRTYPPTPTPNAVAVADWFMVTAKPSLMREVEAFVNTFLTSVPQIEIEAKIIELSESDTLDYGISAPDGVPIFEFPEGTLVDDFSFNLPNTVSGQEAILGLGAIHDETIFNLVIDAIANWENVSIMSMPKIAVREGVRADINSTQDIPYYTFTGLNNSGNFNAALQYKQVGVQLYVVPRVLGTETIALHIDIEASQQIGTLVSFADSGGNELSTPILATRSARTVVHLEPGQAVILGGLTTERTAEAIDKVPVLGDIPIVGHAFKNKFQKTERTHVLFFIRPRILQGIEFQHAGVYGEDW